MYRNAIFKCGKLSKRVYATARCRKRETFANDFVYHHSVLKVCCGVSRRVSSDGSG